MNCLQNLDTMNIDRMHFHQFITFMSDKYMNCKHSQAREYIELPKHVH